MKRLAALIVPYWPYLTGGLLCLALVTLTQLYVPRYVGVTVDTIIRRKSLAVLNTAALMILGVFAVRSIFLYGQIFFGYFLSYRVIADLRQGTFERIQRWSLDRFATWSSSDLITRSLQDTQVAQTTLLNGLFDFAGTLLTLAGILGMLFYLQWRLAAFTLIIIPLLLGAARVFGGEIQRVSQRAQERIGRLATLVRQAFSGARVIRAFVQEEREIARFRRENERTFGEHLRISQLIATQVPVVSFLTALGLVAVLWQGGRLVTTGRMTAGSLVSFLVYAGLAVEPAVGLSRLYASFRQGMGALERVLEISAVPEGVSDARNAVELPPVRGRIDFRGVSFSYDGSAWVLRGLDLAVQPGERVAIVGASGAGKSTLANLIPRFYDPVEGQVKIDGTDLRSVTLRSLRRQIALVPQETVLFHGTVRDNIAYARPRASEAEVLAAARAANAEEFIRGLPRGFDTVLGEDGHQLSGGQRQRIAIARAVLTGAPIVVLDEATSALDAESERLIQDALDRLTEGRTTLVIAHRLSTVRKATRIVVLDQGRIVEEGRHEDLIAREGVYARLAGLQLVEA
jgi:subfamily B ATP-binding cassette protein MsbA